MARVEVDRGPGLADPASTCTRQIVGAGRVMTLEEMLEVTVATALVVVVDGVLVHERYLHGTTPEDRLLGNSATKSALALLVGQARRRRTSCPISTPPSPSWCPSSRPAGTPTSRCVTC